MILVIPQVESQSSLIISNHNSANITRAQIAIIVDFLSIILDIMQCLPIFTSIKQLTYGTI